MTSTPSATAWSMAATRSAVKPLAVEPSCVDHNALYAAMRARDAADLAERGCGARRLNAVVAARRRGGVRAVPVVVPSRHELPRPLSLDRSVAAPGGVVPRRADQLAVAVGRGEVLARRAVPPVPLVEPRHGVDELAVGVTVGEALRLR